MSNQASAILSTKRLRGLDIARFFAFFGMVIVNFNIVIGAEYSDGLAAAVANFLGGKAAATFVVLAGIGLALSQSKKINPFHSVTIKRAAFLLVVGLLNMLVFSADIIHYYAFYFLVGSWMLGLSTRTLVAVIIGLNLCFAIMLFTLNYDAGWNWATYTYKGFWSLSGFVRNLFFNGWHPLVPWLGFLLFGFILSRLKLSEKKTQHRLTLMGAALLLCSEVIARVLQNLTQGVDAELPLILSTSPIPPMPLFTLAGIGSASLIVGLCLRLDTAFPDSAFSKVISTAGKQSLTLYLLHIFFGMSALQLMGLENSQNAAIALLAAMLFCAAALVYTWGWSRHFKRGPVEALMRRLTG